MSKGYAVIYRTGTHVGFNTYSTEAAALKDQHLSPQWCGSVHAVEEIESFTHAEAKDLYITKLAGEF